MSSYDTLRYDVRSDVLVSLGVLSSWFKAPRRLLDLGAGRGTSAFAFAKHGWDVVAIEVDPRERRFLERRRKRFRLLQRVAIPPVNGAIAYTRQWGRFDVVLVDLVYNNVRHRNPEERFPTGRDPARRLLETARRALKPTGKMLVFERSEGHDRWGRTGGRAPIERDRALLQDVGLSIYASVAHVAAVRGGRNERRVLTILGRR